MLLQFKLKNFGCYRDEITLDFTSSALKESKSQLANATVPFDDWKINALPVVAIYGPNASGKSTIVKALDLLLYSLSKFNSRDDKLEMPSRSSVRILCKPFAFDKLSSKAASEFTITVIAKNNIYSYHLAVKDDKVVRELLAYRPLNTKKKRTLFDRKGKKIASVSEDLRSVKHVAEKLSDTHLLLEFIGNYFEIPVVAPLTKWINQYLFGLGKHSAFLDIILGQLISKSPTVANDLVDFLKAFDIGVDGVTAKEQKKDEGRPYTFSIHRKLGNINTSFPLSFESSGTIKLMRIFTPIYFGLKAGGLVALDEIANELHPNITKKIVSLFQNREINYGNGQLITTTHESNLLSDSLRRDQIWLTAKSSDYSAEILPLTDFSPRKTLNLEDAYLDGRFDSTPFINENLLRKSILPKSTTTSSGKKRSNEKEKSQKKITK